jgi:hypothetical protein
VHRIADGDRGHAGPAFDDSVRHARVAGLAGRRGVTERRVIARTDQGIGIGRGDCHVVSLAPWLVRQRRVGACIERDVVVRICRRAAESTRDEHPDRHESEASAHGITVK